MRGRMGELRTHPPPHPYTQHLSSVWSYTGSKEEPARGLEPACKVAVPYQPAFICCLFCLQRGWRSCGWSWELSLQPISAVDEDGVGMKAATPVSLMLQEGAARGI